MPKSSNVSRLPSTSSSDLFLLCGFLRSCRHRSLYKLKIILNSGNCLLCELLAESRVEKFLLLGKAVHKQAFDEHTRIFRHLAEVEIEVADETEAVLAAFKKPVKYAGGEIAVTDMLVVTARSKLCER